MSNKSQLDIALENLNDFAEDNIKLREKNKQALQELREMDTLFHSVNENEGLDRFKNNIIAKINEVIGGNNE